MVWNATSGEMIADRTWIPVQRSGYPGKLCFHKTVLKIFYLLLRENAKALTFFFIGICNQFALFIWFVNLLQKCLLIPKAWDCKKLIAMTHVSSKMYHWLPMITSLYSAYLLLGCFFSYRASLLLLAVITQRTQQWLHRKGLSQFLCWHLSWFSSNLCRCPTCVFSREKLSG